MRKQILVYILCFCVGCFSCQQASEDTVEVNLSVVAEIGIEEAKNEEEKPYQFSAIRDVDCDEEGNIYVLDHKDVCVKVFDQSGQFLRKMLSQGGGPHEVMNPYGLKINKFKETLFVLHEHGYQLKEFDVYGEYINQYALSEQVTHYFDFLDDNTFIYVSKGRYGEDEYKSLKILDLKLLDIMLEFAPTKRNSQINGYQRFVIQDDTLWTCPGDKMELIGYDLKTGDVWRQVPVDMPYSPYKIIRKEYAPGVGWAYARIFNFAQPFFIDDDIFIFLTLQEYPEDTSQAFPPDKRIIKMYRLENSDLMEARDFSDFGFLVDIHACWQNRIIASSSAYDLVPKIVVLEIKE